MNNSMKGAVYLSLAAAIWGGLFLAVRLVVGVVEAVPLVWLRYVLALGALFVLGEMRHVSWKIQPKDYKLVLAVGLIGQTLSIVTQESGTLLTSAQTGSTITAATPAFMVIFGWLILKEEMTVRRILSLLMATVGVLCIVFDPDNFQMDVLGGFYLLIAAVTWALMAVILKLLKEYSAITLTFYGTLIAVICLAPYALWWLAEEADFIAMSSPQIWGAILYMGIISTTGGFVLWNEGLLYMDASVAGLFMFTQPIVGTILGWCILGEPLTLWFWIGAFLIGAGVVTVIQPNKKKE